MRVVIAGGGTTGHLSPAIAVAEILRGRGDEVLFIGTSSGPEARVVPAEGFEFIAVKVIGRQRGTVSARNARAVIALGTAIVKCNAILRRFSPNVVLGTGGYVSLPAAFAANLRRVPLVIHEQNSVPGLANRVAQRFAQRVAVSFPETKTRFGPKAVVTGNPVRAGIAGLDRSKLRAEALEHFGLKPGLPTLLVFGGSQGAVNINNAVFAAFDYLRDVPMQVLHLTGPRNFGSAQQRLLELANPSDALIWRLVDYSDQMALCYSAADLALCRSGASTISELAACGLPAILVPLPGSLDEDQRHNAEALVDAGAARMILDSNLTGEVTAAVVREMLFDETLLMEMSSRIRRFFSPQAAELLARLLSEAAKP